MKLKEALNLREGDLVDVGLPNFQEGGVRMHYGCKVLIISSKGGIYVSERDWRAFWTRYHYARLLGWCEALTERERELQVGEIERFEGYRVELRGKERERRLRNLRPQELYCFLHGVLEGGESYALEELQARARASGLEADAVTWRRVWRVVSGWRFSNRELSKIVMPASAVSPTIPLGLG
jgi:hypothetical protein